jgi:GntR family transcriptional regulator / MocR family aminotransferase
MLRPWDLNWSETIPVRRESSVSVHLQIVQAVIDEIQRGRLPAGAALPGARKLAALLGVNRKTIVLAYDELIAQGWLTTQEKRGTFVSPALPASEILPVPARPSNPADRPLSSCLTHERDAPDIIDFKDGTPDTRLIPFDVLSRAFRRALIASARANRLGYDDSRGALALRQAVSAMLAMERGLSVSPDGVCLVRGSQMGVFLAARLLVQPRDCVVLERLSYPPAREAFRSCGARILSIGLDEYGMRMDELEELCRRNKVSAVYATPHHQYPTTVMMSAERRMKLLMLAEQYGFAIVEDDYDHEFHFSHRPTLPLASVDRAGRVIYVGSLSKVLAPGLRVGYMVASPDFIRRCGAEVLLIDRQGNAVTELAIAELMENGELKRHIRRTLKIYGERRKLLAGLLRRDLPHVGSFALPEGGLAFWLRLEEGLDAEQLARRALVQRVRLLPGGSFADQGAPDFGAPVQAVRLGFGNLNAEEIARGVARLRLAVDGYGP